MNRNELNGEGFVFREVELRALQYAVSVHPALARARANLERLLGKKLRKKAKKRFKRLVKVKKYYFRRKNAEKRSCMRSASGVSGRGW